MFWSVGALLLPRLTALKELKAGLGSLGNPANSEISEVTFYAIAKLTQLRSLTINFPTPALLYLPQRYCLCAASQPSGSSKSGAPKVVWVSGSAATISGMRTWACWSRDGLDWRNCVWMLILGSAVFKGQMVEVLERWCGCFEAG